MIGIYKITNVVNGKCYIGQSRDIIRRWQTERYNSTNSNCEAYNSALSQAFRKYGIQNFTFEILEECSLEQLNERECYWAEYYNSYSPNGYNIAYCGQNYNIQGQSLKINQVREIINLLQTTDLTQSEIGEQFGVHWKTIQQINTGVRWHILKDEEYPIRERYFRKKEQVLKQTVYNKLPSPLECLIQIAKWGFESTCAHLQVCRTTLKNHLITANLPTSKKEIVQYYKQNILFEPIVEKRQMSTGRVAQIDMSTQEIINIFENGHEAGRALGDVNKRKHINEVCAGTRKSAYGFYWKRIK